MIPQLVLFVSLFLFWKLIRWDVRQRKGVSAAIWIPTLWVGIIASRSLSHWVGFGGGEDSLEGSPLDRLFYFGMIFLALVVVHRRGVNWAEIISDCWPI